MAVLKILCQIIHTSITLGSIFGDYFFVPLFGLHFPVSSFSLRLCVVVRVFEKTVTFPSSSGLASYKGRSLPISPARASGSFSQLFCGYVFTRLCKFIIRRIFWFLVQEYIISCCLSYLSAVLWVLWSCSIPLHSFFGYQQAPGI